MSQLELRALDDRLTAQLRRALARAFAEARGRIPITAIERLIQLRGLTVFEIERLLQILPALIQQAADDTVRRATVASARIAVDDLHALRLVARLDLVNPEAVRAARTQVARLVTLVTAQTKAAIRTVIATAIQHGIAVRDAGRLIRPMIGLNERQATAVMNFRFTLLERGASGETVAKAAERYTAKLIRQRALMIARTETISALTRGRHATWQTAIREGWLPMTAEMVWQTADDERVCPVCAPLDGKTAVMGGRFSSSLGALAGPPAHPACRCSTAISTASLSLRRTA